jgi:hypothetical protein
MIRKAVLYRAAIPFFAIKTAILRFRSLLGGPKVQFLLIFSISSVFSCSNTSWRTFSRSSQSLIISRKMVKMISSRAKISIDKKMYPMTSPKTKLSYLKLSFGGSDLHKPPVSNLKQHKNLSTFSIFCVLFQ